MRYRDPKKRFDAVWRLCKPKMICETNIPQDDDSKDAQKELGPGHGGCGNIQPEVRKDGLKLIGTWKAQKGDDDNEAQQPEKKPITPQMALNIFRHMSAEDITNIGLSNDYARPEWMIITVLPVPPPPVRPSIKTDAGDGPAGEDDLTYKLGDIIRANGNVRRGELEGTPAHIIEEFETLLQFHVATYMANDTAGQPQALQKSGRPVKAIRSRLKGKEGRVRGNLMGKRVDFSARTVITGDPNLSLDEVGVPRSIARTLTYLRQSRRTTSTSYTSWSKTALMNILVPDMLSVILGRGSICDTTRERETFHYSTDGRSNATSLTETSSYSIVNHRCTRSP